MSGEVNVIPTLRKFRGGASRSIFRGGQSRGGGQLKKPPCTYVSGVRSTSFKCAMNSSFCDPSLDNFQLTKGGERYVAMFPYTGQYEDELSFEVIK